MNTHRVRLLNQCSSTTEGPVIYWMSRDQRVNDNWALLFAQSLACEIKQPLAVAFCLVPEFLSATIRHYAFMIKGLQEVEETLIKKNIGFILLTGSPEKEILTVLKNFNASRLITDFDPLRIKRKWKELLTREINIPFYEVDAHNIVPCWAASQKQEFGAYTIRPKINRLLPEFMDEFDILKKHPYPFKTQTLKTNWGKASSSLKKNQAFSELTWIKPGEKASRKALNNFLENGLKNYATARNDPTLDCQSNLSPYLHFGQISSQRVALEASKLRGNTESRKAFLEELIVRRELSDNYCFYNATYDQFEGFPMWSKITLNQHRKDSRAYIYSLTEFEEAKTHDNLWNAAQVEMVEHGKMHGYLRMYWAKKILEWTPSPEDAMEIAIYLNDKYELDGRDPNGYTGIAWSIGGVHDRAWGERPVFGKIRYMSYNGCKSKFNINAYINKYQR